MEPAWGTQEVNYELLATALLLYTARHHILSTSPTMYLKPN